MENADLSIPLKALSRRRVVSDNLSIEKLTIVDGGNGGGLPAFVGSLTGSVVSVMEQVKNATGLDIPGILQTKATQPRDKGLIRNEP